MTKRLMKQIAAGGIIIAPRVSGKTTAIVELMCKDPSSYVLVALNHNMACYIRSALKEKGFSDADRRVILPNNVDKLRGRPPYKVIIDEAFWNPAFYNNQPYHCALSSAPKRMVVYNKKGRQITVNNQDVWNGQ